VNPPPPDALLEVGHVARAHGLRGQVVVELVTNRAERVEPGARLVDPDGRTLEVTSSGPSNSSGGRRRYVVAFAGVTDRAGAEALRGTVLLAAPLADDGDDTLWIHELIGAAVVDPDGGALGTVVAVQANPASDLLVLDNDALVPLRFVTAHQPGRLTVDAPAGLFDL
jgi:16S rRNA processing protein RimM